MGLISTNPRTWVSVATVLATLALGCEGTSGETRAAEGEFVRKAAVGDAGAEDTTNDGEDATDGDEGRLDASVASLDGSTPASLDGGGSTVTNDETDAAVQLTDNQIFGILVANNDAELSAAAAGEDKLRGSATRELARGVTRSANAAKLRYALLTSVEGLTPEDSQQSADRKRVAGDIDAMLQTEPPSDSLDLRYAFGEAMTNQLLVDLIDETLLPQADSELLKSELRTARETAQRRVRDGGELVNALSPSVVPDQADADSAASDAGTR